MSVITPDITALFLSEGPDHEGHAQCVAGLYPGQFLYVPAYGWLAYTGTHWEATGAEARLERAIVDTLRQRRAVATQHDREAIVRATAGSRYNVSGTMALMQSLLIADVADFDNDPDKLNVANGVVDLRTGALAPHSPDQRYTYCVPVPCEPGAYSEEWERFLLSSVGGGPAAIDYLQKYMGYAITGRTREEMLLYIYGPTRSGKGTFTEPLLALLPRPLATGIDFETLTAARYGDTNNFDLAPLKPARLVVASESQKYGALNAAKIKQLTGGDHIRCSFKYGPHFTYRPQFKILLASNHKLNVDVDDDAAWGRVGVISFPNSHLGKEDKLLKERLKSPENLKGILAWLIEGARRWYALPEGLEAPQSVKDETRRHRDELDHVAQFIDECCVIAGAAFAESADLHHEYKNWCEENGHKPMYQRWFARALSAKGFETKQKKVKGRNRRVVEGLGLHYGEPPEKEPEEESWEKLLKIGA